MNKVTVGKQGIRFNGNLYAISSNDFPSFIGKQVFIVPEGDDRHLTVFTLNKTFLFRAELAPFVSSPTVGNLREAIRFARQISQKALINERMKKASKPSEPIQDAIGELSRRVKKAYPVLSGAELNHWVAEAIKHDGSRIKDVFDAIDYYLECVASGEKRISEQPSEHSESPSSFHCPQEVFEEFIDRLRDLNPDISFKTMQPLFQKALDHTFNSMIHREEAR